MSQKQKLDAPKLPNGTYPELSPNPNSKGVELKDGGRGTPVVVNTEPRKSNTNTITVDEVKRLIREAIDHFEKEEGGVTEDEMERYVSNAIKDKADKIGGLPYFEVKLGDNVLDFINNNDVADKPIIFKTSNNFIYIGEFRSASSYGYYSFEIENLASPARYEGSNQNMSGKVFSGIFQASYESPYALRKDFTQIHSFNEATVLTDSIWSDLKTGDILKVNNMQFIINVFETTGEGAYKGVTGTMVGAVTANSITIASLDWRTVGEGHTALEPTLTTLTIGGNE